MSYSMLGIRPSPVWLGHMTSFLVHCMLKFSTRRSRNWSQVRLQTLDFDGGRWWALAWELSNGVIVISSTLMIGAGRASFHTFIITSTYQHFIISPPHTEMYVSWPCTTPGTSFGSKLSQFISRPSSSNKKLWSAQQVSPILSIASIPWRVIPRFSTANRHFNIPNVHSTSFRMLSIH